MGLDQPRVIIYVKFVELKSPMLHAKFQDHRTLGSRDKVFKVLPKYGHGGHLGHVTKTVFIN